MEPVIGPSEHDRMLLALHMGRKIDLVFLVECEAVGLDFDEAIASGAPLAALVKRRRDIAAWRALINHTAGRA